MIRRLRIVLLLLIAGATPACAAHFTVLDEKATEELSETTRLYLDGTLAATIRLDDANTKATIPVDVPDAAGPHGMRHDYALCGEITFRNPAGALEIHEVSGQGVLPDPDGHAFIALGTGNFTLFFLADPKDRNAVRIRPGHSPFCQTPVS